MAYKQNILANHFHTQNTSIKHPHSDKNETLISFKWSFNTKR